VEETETEQQFLILNWLQTIAELGLGNASVGAQQIGA
jgi:hypothetical protein